MKSRLVWQAAGERTYVLVLDAGDEAFAAIADFASKNGLGGASLTALGAFERATVGWFDLRARTYRPIEIDEQCEGLSLLGDIAIGDDGKPCSASRTARRAAAISSRASCGRRLRSPSSRLRRISAAASRPRSASLSSSSRNRSLGTERLQRRRARDR